MPSQKLEEKLGKLSLEQKQTIGEKDYHRQMAIMLDLAYSICYEKRVCSFGELSAQTSPWTLVKLTQSLASLTDMECFQLNHKRRYQMYITSSIRRALTFGCYRSFDFAQQALTDVIDLGKVGGIEALLSLIEEARSVMEESSEFNLKWCSICLLNDLIVFLKDTS